MTETVAAMKLRKRRNRLYEKGALELIEEAVHLLRSTRSTFMASYYMGAIPFVIGFLYFWSDMSRGAYGHAHIASASFGMALLYIWMKYWQAVYCRQIFVFLSGKNTIVWTVRAIARLVLIQTVIQPSALFVLPVALIMTIPFSWVYAFYFNVSVLGSAAEEGNPREIISQSIRQAVLWPIQNHILISVIFLFGFFVFVNLGITIYLIPHFLKNILGFETIFTRIGISMLNSTFFAAIFSLCYLVMNPLISTVYTLRCFYGSSIRSGADLIGQLRTAFGAEKIVTVMLILMLFVPTRGYAQILQQSKEMSVSSEELERQIMKEMKKPEYAWRQGVKDQEEDKGIIEKFFTGIVDFISEALDTIYDWVKKFFEWLDDVMPGQESRDKKSISQGSRAYFLYTLIFIGATVGIFFLWRFLSAKKSTFAEAPRNSEALSVPELTDHYVAADQLTSDKWMELAHEMTAKGELRLALRTVYLSTLAMLGQYGLITIARFKSNRDYEHELSRKIRSAQPLLHFFSYHVAEFNQSWYGAHPVTNECLDKFIENHKRICTSAVQ